MSQSSAVCNRSLARRCFGNYHETGSEEGADLLSCLCPDPGLSMGGKPFLADGAYEPQTHILKKKIDFWQWSTEIPLCLTYKHHCPILPRLLPNGVGGNKKRIQTFEWCVLKMTALHCTWRHDTNRLHVPATSLRKTVLALIHGSRKRHGSACSDFVQTRLWRSHWYL